MNLKTKEEKVIERILTTRSVSRNWALQNRVSRLGAIINKLISSDWKFDSHKSKTGDNMRHGHYVKTKYGLDYVYNLVSPPKKIKRI